MLEAMEISDPESLRAIANPVRQRILMQLAVAGHARAADLAEAIGQPANSVSFHLRVLAKAGLIVEAPEHARDKRDRVWTNAAETFYVRSGAGDASALILRPAVKWLTQIFAQDGGDDEPQDRTFMLVPSQLTHDEAAQMITEISEVMSRWSERSIAGAREHPEAPRETYQTLIAIGRRDQPADRRDEPDADTPKD